jgi:hypothetical protein
MCGWAGFPVFPFCVFNHLFKLINNLTFQTKVILCFLQIIWMNYNLQFDIGIPDFSWSKLEPGLPLPLRILDNQPHFINHLSKFINNLTFQTKVLYSLFFADMNYNLQFDIINLPRLFFPSPQLKFSLPQSVVLIWSYW